MKTLDNPILYSREQHGAMPVYIHQTEKGPLYRLGDVTYHTKSQLLATITGQEQCWSFDRYFGLGKYAPPSGTILDLFAPATAPHTQVQSTLQLAPSLITILSDTRITTANRPASASPLASVTMPLGVDLDKRGHEVAKLLFAGFGKRIHAAGYDPQDVLQYVYLGIMARNRGKCPWDPAKSSFGHYVHMVCGCLLANYHRKQATLREHEQVGVAGHTDDGSWGLMDVAASSHAKALPSETQDLSRASTDLLKHLKQCRRIAPNNRRLLEKAIPLMAQGHTRKEAAGMLSVSVPTLTRALAQVRTATYEWCSST
jgi:hypothetical protein